MKVFRRSAHAETINVKRCIHDFSRPRILLLQAWLGLALWWPGASHAQTIPKFLDAADRSADAKESFEFSNVRTFAKSAFLTREKKARMQTILRDRNERNFPELTALVNSASVPIFPDLDLMEACKWILSVQERTLGTNNPKTALTAKRLGMMHMVVRDFPQAKRCFEECLPAYKEQLLSLSTSKKNLGFEDYEICLALGYLSEITLQEGDFDAAEAYQRRLLTIHQAQQDGSAEAGSEIYLARIAHAKGDWSASRIHYDAANKKFVKKGGSDLEEGNRLNAGSALLYLDAGRREDAVREARKIWQSSKLRYQQILSFTEDIALMIAQNEEPYSLAAALHDTPQLAQLILDWKGCVLETELAFKKMEMDVGSSRASSLLNEMRTAQQGLTQLQSMSPAVRAKVIEGKARVREQIRNGPFSEAQKRAMLQTQEDEQKKVDRLTAELAAAKVADPRISATVTSVSNCLGPRQALVEYLRYYRYLGNARWERAYGAMIFSQGNQPQWVPLDRATVLDALATNLGLKVTTGDAPGNESLHSILRETCEAVWTPVAKALPVGVDDVVIGPDGALSFLPFAALLDSRDQFLAENLRFSFVASGRDLLRRTDARNSGTFALFGDPDYNHAGATSKGRALKQEPAPALTAAQQNLLHAAGFSKFDPLPGTREECRRLAELLSRRGITPTLRIGSGASEAALRELRAPRALHLATHGAFLPAQLPENFVTLFTERAAQRSVIFLAGAQWTLDDRARGLSDAAPGQDEPASGGLEKSLNQMIFKELRRRGQDGQGPGGPADPIHEDGIVTAEEIRSLPLDGTWLVTLSACKTALGQARAGEGVIGLRRSFVEAGAQNLLMSLWPISDEVTPDIMVDFYRRALEANDAPRAWAETQRDWLKKRFANDKVLDAEARLLDAVVHAGAFVLSRQGNPSPDARK